MNTTPTCEKVAFPSERTAKHAARLLRDTGEPFTHYACPHCGRWHLTTTTSYDSPSGHGPFFRPKRQRRVRVHTLEQLERVAESMRGK